MLAAVPIDPAAGVDDPARANADPPEWLEQLRVGRWTKLHEQGRNDAVRFVRQRHGGGAFDRRRGRVILFGSDTHGIDWTNSPLIFDTRTLQWNRLYPDDSVESYAVNAEGVAVAGRAQNHPWAMHSFGAVSYDEHRDELVVASYPGHLAPGRFTNVLAELWPKVRRHATWVLHMGSHRWRPLPAEPVHFFPYATAYDSSRQVVIGYRSDGVYELAGEPRRWRRVTSPGLLGYHNNAVYDARHRALIVFGADDGGNDVVVYKPASGEHRRMPSPGRRPPKARHVPMAYHEGLAGTIVLIAPPSKAVERTDTWRYDLAADRWQLIETAGLPLRLGMNYNLYYDPRRDLLWLVTGGEGEATAVWALKL